MTSEISQADRIIPPGLPNDSAAAQEAGRSTEDASVSQTGVSPAVRSLRSNKRKRSESSIDEPDEEDEIEVGVDETTNFSPADSICLCQPDPKIPRPRNAFILYRQHHQANVVSQNPSLSNPDISKLLGEQWRNSPAEVKSEWKRYAEAEKQRHKEQHPDYRYQPRRSGRRESVIENARSVHSAACHKCGGHLLNSPSAPMSASAPTSALASGPPSARSTPQGQHFPPIGGFPLTSAQHRQSIHASRPSSIAIPARNEVEMSAPDSKRRRYTNGQVPVAEAHRPSIGNSYVLPTPYRNSYAGRYGPEQPRQWGPLSAGSIAVQRSSVRPRQDSNGVILAPLQLPATPQSVEQHVMNMPFLVKVYQLGRISPPYYAPANDQADATRGAVVAVEGDDQAAVADVVKWLEDFLSRDGQFYVKTAQGPTGPRPEETPSISDYFKVIAEWQTKSKEIAAFITKPVTAKSGGHDAESHEIPPDAPSPAMLKPVILLQRFQLFASNAYAVRIPIKDSYKPLEHWQWMASLWRGTIGPDVTICIKDVRPEEIGKESKVVEVQDALRTVVVKRGVRAGPESLKPKLDESALRRLGFEVGELIRNAGAEQSHAEALMNVVGERGDSQNSVKDL